MELSCSIQKYEWGKYGSKSKVANLFKNSNPDFVIDENTPYAELWMGTHVNGPSRVKKTGQSLLLAISERPEYLGDTVVKRFGNALPFMLKVLSINKALSIQVHPSKQHAEQLHNQQPNIYKDPNHKPEMAIALTEFQALCGFRPISEIKYFLKIIPELAEVVGKELLQSFSDSDKNEAMGSLQKCFRALMVCPQETITGLLKRALERFSKLGPKERDEQLAELVERLYSEFPNDVGCFAVYFMNVVTLQPNEAIYLGANEPHAYLKGDCIECMACSDNVVRAGLTPKFKDVDTLCSMLNYAGQPAQSKLFRPKEEDKYTQMFQPPVPDFAIVKIEIPSGASSYSLIVRKSASILLIVTGSANSEGMEFGPGTTIFIPANGPIKLTNVTANFLAFQALANV